MEYIPGFFFLSVGDIMPVLRRTNIGLLLYTDVIVISRTLITVINKRVLMGVPSYQLTTNFSANCQLTTNFS